MRGGQACEFLKSAKMQGHAASSSTIFYSGRDTTVTMRIYVKQDWILFLLYSSIDPPTERTRFCIFLAPQMNYYYFF